MACTKVKLFSGVICAMLLGLLLCVFFAGWCSGEGRRMEKVERDIPMSAMLLFMPEISDRDMSFVGSVIIEVYERSNMRFSLKNKYREDALANGWVRMSWRSDDFDNEDYQEQVIVHVVKVGDLFRCDWIYYLNGSLGSHSGSFYFSIEQERFLYEGKETRFHVIVYKGSAEGFCGDDSLSVEMWAVH